MAVCGIVSFVDRVPAWSEKDGGSGAEEIMEMNAAIDRQLQAGIKQYVIIMDSFIGLQAAISLRVGELQLFGVHYTAVMLWEEQAAYWPERIRDWWFRAFQACSKEIILEPRLTEKNREKRDQYLLDHCHKLLIFTTGPNAEADALEKRAAAAGLVVEQVRLDRPGGGN